MHKYTSPPILALEQNSIPNQNTLEPIPQEEYLRTDNVREVMIAVPFIKASPERVFAASTAADEVEAGAGLVSAAGCSVKLAR